MTNHEFHSASRLRKGPLFLTVTSRYYQESVLTIYSHIALVITLLAALAKVANLQSLCCLVRQPSSLTLLSIFARTHQNWKELEGARLVQRTCNARSQVSPKLLLVNFMGSQALLGLRCHRADGGFDDGTLSERLILSLPHPCRPLLCSGCTSSA